MACAWLTRSCLTPSLPSNRNARGSPFANFAWTGVGDLIDWLLAFSPILVVLVLMLGFRWGGAKAGPVGWLVAVFVAIAYFGANLELLAYSQLKGLLLTVYVLYIIWMALFFYHTVDEAGAVEVIGTGLPRLTADRALQALLLGWVFSAFLQGAGGFGVPVAVTAPLLIGLGFPRLAAVVIPSLGHGWAVSFGSLGSSFYALIAATGRSGEELAPWSAIMLGLCCLICGAAVLWAAGGPRALRNGLIPMLIVGLSMASIQYLVVTNGFWSLGALCAGLVGLAVSLLLFRIPRFQGSAEQQAAVHNQPTTLPLPLALSPYVLLMLVIIGGQLIGPVQHFLGRVVIRAEFPELSTSKGWVTPAEAGRTIDVFGHAGALLFYASLLSYVLLLWKGHYGPGAMKRIANNTVRRAGRSSIGVATMVGMAVVMQHAGMTHTLAKGVAETFGGVYPLVSPFIGALGAFMTGSNTNSNVVFGDFQQTAARLLGLNELIILAAQTAGGAIGSTFAPAKVIVGASTAGLGGEEGPVLRKVMIYGTVLVAIVGLATALAVSWAR
jgi:lactate permease